MEFVQMEIDALGLVAIEAEQVQELSSLQLAIIGGGVGEVIFG